MFSGIVTDVGRVRTVTEAPGGGLRLEIGTAYDTATIALGASIACSGPCLTVVDKGPGWFAVDVSCETADRTTLGDWREGTGVNLERALALGDELGGHLVTGHIDGVAAVEARNRRANRSASRSAARRSSRASWRPRARSRSTAPR